MRVALVCGTYAPRHDGVSDYVRRLALELRAVGVGAVVAARRGSEPDAPIDAGVCPDNDDVEPVGVVADWSWRELRRSARALDALGVDLVHVQFAPSAYGYRAAVGWLPALLRTPVVTTLHEYGWWAWPGWLPDRIWPVLERGGRLDRESGLLAPRSRALLVTNDAHAAVVSARLGRAVDVVPIAPNVTVVPTRNGDDAASPAGTDAVRERVRRRYGVPEVVPLLVFFGFVHPVKGVRELIDAIALLRRSGRDVRVVVAGGFSSLALPGAEALSFRAEVERRIATAAVEDRVTLTGWLPPAEVSALLSAADAVVLPFTHGVTTKSGSLLAALAHRAPVLATVADDPEPHLVDGETVVRIDRRRDPAAIALALARLLDDPELAARVATGGAAFAAAREWPVVARAHREVYARVLGR